MTLHSSILAISFWLQLLAGVQLNDEPASIAASAYEILAERLLRLTTTEGKYHLVKRMIAAAGNRAEGLNRVAIGGLICRQNYRSANGSGLRKPICRSWRVERRRLEKLF